MLPIEKHRIFRVDFLKGLLINDKTLENNIICTIEELSELTKVLTKYMRNSEKFNKDSLIEEVSHVLLMVDIISLRFNLSKNDIILNQISTLERAIKQF